jgi:hypothetical protein
MKKILLSVFVLSILVPNLVFASWWNPFSWFTKQPKSEQTNPINNKPIMVSTDTTTPTTTPKQTANSSKKITKTDTQICVEKYGAHTYATKNKNDGVDCLCENNYDWNGKKCILIPPKTTLTPVTQTPPTSNTAVSQQQTTNIQLPPPTPIGTLCNGKYYSSCSTGNDFICPSSGGVAFCQPSQSQKLATLQAQLQMYQNALIPINKEIQKYQNEYNSLQCSSFTVSRALGEQGQANLLKSQNCLAISQAENSAIQQKTPILNQISYIQQQIFNLSY